MFDFFPRLCHPVSMSKKPTSKSKSGQVTELPDSAAGADGLTARQQIIIDFIKSEVRDKGYPPSMRAIAAAAGMSSTASVKYQLDALREKNRIKIHPTRGGVEARGIADFAHGWGVALGF